MTNQSGRSKTGRLRNFAAMSDQKLTMAWEALHLERNDPEAMSAVNAELDARSDQMEVDPKCEAAVDIVRKMDDELRGMSLDTEAEQAEYWVAIEDAVKARLDDEEISAPLILAMAIQWGEHYPVAQMCGDRWKSLLPTPVPAGLFVATVTWVFPSFEKRGMIDMFGGIESRRAIARVLQTFSSSKEHYDEHVRELDRQYGTEWMDGRGKKFFADDDELSGGYKFGLSVVEVVAAEAAYHDKALRKPTEAQMASFKELLARQAVELAAKS